MTWGFSGDDETPVRAIIAHLAAPARGLTIYRGFCADPPTFARDRLEKVEQHRDLLLRSGPDPN